MQYMGVPFGDIAVHAPIPFPVRSSAWNEINSLINFVSDFYVQNMNGYKPVLTQNNNKRFRKIGPPR